MISQPGDLQLNVVRDQSYELRLTLQENHGTEEAPDLQPVDLSSAEFWAEIRTKRSIDAPVVTTFTVELGTDPGQLLLRLEPAQSRLVRKDAAWDLKTRIDGWERVWVGGPVAVTDVAVEAAQGVA